jgi:hypothetical protein
VEKFAGYEGELEGRAAGAEGVARWDVTQFLHELVGEETALGHFRACLSAGVIDEPGAWRILAALMPALASRDLSEALDGERANTVYLQVLAPVCQRAWDTYAAQLADVPLSPSRLLGLIRTCFHLLGLLPSRFYVLQRTSEQLCNWPSVVNFLGRTSSARQQRNCWSASRSLLKRSEMRMRRRPQPPRKLTPGALRPITDEAALVHPPTRSLTSSLRHGAKCPPSPPEPTYSALDVRESAPPRGRQVRLMRAPPMPMQTVSHLRLFSVL